jgi:hypothetical protein
MRIQKHYSAYTAEAIKAEVDAISAEVIYDIREMRKEDEFKDLHSQKALIEAELRVYERLEKNKS